MPYIEYGCNNGRMTDSISSPNTRIQPLVIIALPSSGPVQFWQTVCLRSVSSKKKKKTLMAPLTLTNSKTVILLVQSALYLTQKELTIFGTAVQQQALFSHETFIASDYSP